MFPELIIQQYRTRKMPLEDLVQEPSERGEQASLDEATRMYLIRKYTAPVARKAEELYQRVHYKGLALKIPVAGFFFGCFPKDIQEDVGTILGIPKEQRWKLTAWKSLPEPHEALLYLHYLLPSSVHEHLPSFLQQALTNKHVTTTTALLTGVLAAEKIIYYSWARLKKEPVFRPLSIITNPVVTGVVAYRHLYLPHQEKVQQVITAVRKELALMKEATRIATQPVTPLVKKIPEYSFAASIIAWGLYHDPRTTMSQYVLPLIRNLNKI